MVRALILIAACMGLFPAAAKADGMKTGYWSLPPAFTSLPSPAIEQPAINRERARVLRMSELRKAPYVSRVAYEGERKEYDKLCAEAEIAPAIGANVEQALASIWCFPDKVNKTVTAHGVSEQWVYDARGYLYFENGVLTAIQTH